MIGYIFKRIIKNFLSLWMLLFGTFFRDKNLVVVVTCHNTFSGNCKYAVKAIQNNFPEKKILWLVNTEIQREEMLKHTDIQVSFRYGFEMLWAIIRAKYIFTDGNFVGGWYGNGATQVDFWHGSPIKKIRYDGLQKEPSLSKKMIMYLNRHRYIQSGGSLYDAQFLAKAGRLPLCMARPLGLPCIAPLIDKVLFQEEIDSDARLQNIQDMTKAYDKVFLYAPTFRDSNTDFLQKLKFDINKIQKVCVDKNIIFLIKMHPWCNISLDVDYPNVKVLDPSHDATLCIGLSDVIITDYSSMYHNAIAGDKDIIIMHGDIEDYKENSRDVYEEVLDNIQGCKVSDFNDVCTIIENDVDLDKVPQEIINLYWDKENIKDPYRFLKVMK